MPGQRDTQFHVLRATVVRVSPQFIDAEPVSGVHFDRAGPSKMGRTLDVCCRENKDQHECLNVLGWDERPVNLSFDVIVEEVLVVCLGTRDERHSRGDAGSESARTRCPVAERRSSQRFLCQAKVGRAEPR